MEIRNTTKRPLRVPLPGGKTLHLGPLGSGQVTPKALEHPPLKKLVEGGEVEVVGGGRGELGGGSEGKTSKTSSPRPQGGGASGGPPRIPGDR